MIKNCVNNTQKKEKRQEKKEKKSQIKSLTLYIKKNKLCLIPKQKKVNIMSPQERLISYLPVISKAFELGLKPKNLQMFAVTEANDDFYWWASYQKKQSQDGKLNPMVMEEIGEKPFNKVFCCPIFDKLRAVAKFDSMETNIDLETTRKVFLVMTKKAGEENLTYEVTTKKPKKFKADKATNWNDIEFVVVHDIKNDIDSIREKSELLSKEERAFFEKYKNVNTELSVSELKFKNILKKHIKGAFDFKDLEPIALELWKKAVTASRKEKGRKLPYMKEITESLKWNMSDIGEEYGLTRERIRQVTNDLFESFDERLARSVKIQNINSKA